MSSESWSRSSSSRSRYDDRKRRDRHYDDHDRDYDDRRRRRHSPDRDRRRGSSERDRYRSYDDDRDSRNRRGKSPSRRHRQSRSRSRSSSYESSKRRKSHREPFRSAEKKSSHSAELSNIKILRASRSRSKSQNKTADDHSDRKNNYFESFRTTNVDNNSLIGNIDESDFDREKIHKEMQERLQLHLAREGKVYPPPKPQASHPIFANDGSFLETFKKLQEQQKQHVHDHHKVEPSVAAMPVVQQQYQKPMFSKRRGGKILKTGIVQKTKITDESVTEETPNDAWSLYLQEVKKYKNVSCDADSKTRPLVK
ncbi:hypothetical protein HA402_002187 [Bradysia odoriphaga]|nr:hypothetical protein HA402_002187 [Bradysia odoriphaga]